MVNDTTRLLGLDGLTVERVELDAIGVRWRTCPPVVSRRGAARSAGSGRSGYSNGPLTPPRRCRIVDAAQFPTLEGPGRRAAESRTGPPGVGTCRV